MQEHGFRELERRASAVALEDEVKKLEARTRVQDEIEKMKAEGKALVLTDEEEKVLFYFRRFKLRMRKKVETFTWQTRRAEGVEIVEETAEILHPQEVGDSSIQVPKRGGLE